MPVTTWDLLQIAAWPFVLCRPRGRASLPRYDGLTTVIYISHWGSLYGTRLLLHPQSHQGSSRRELSGYHIHWAQSHTARQVWDSIAMYCSMEGWVVEWHCMSAAAPWNPMSWRQTFGIDRWDGHSWPLWLMQGGHTSFYEGLGCTQDWLHIAGYCSLRGDGNSDGWAHLETHRYWSCLIIKYLTGIIYLLLQKYGCSCSKVQYPFLDGPTGISDQPGMPQSWPAQKVVLLFKKVALLFEKGALLFEKVALLLEKVVLLFKRVALQSESVVHWLEVHLDTHMSTM